MVMTVRAFCIEIYHKQFWYLFVGFPEANLYWKPWHLTDFLNNLFHASWRIFLKIVDYKNLNGEFCKVTGILIIFLIFTVWLLFYCEQRKCTPIAVILLWFAFEIKVILLKIHYCIIRIFRFLPILVLLRSNVFVLFIVFIWCLQYSQNFGDRCYDHDRLIIE